MLLWCCLFHCYNCYVNMIITYIWKLWFKTIIFYKLLANFNNCLYSTSTHSNVSCLRVFNYNYIYSSLCTLYSNIYKKLAPSQQICILGNPTLITPIKQSVLECQVEYICYFFNFFFTIRFNGNPKYSYMSIQINDFHYEKHCVHCNLSNAIKNYPMQLDYN
jgi:hypothetical protein